MFSSQTPVRALLMALLPSLMHGCGGHDKYLQREPVTFVLLDASTSVSGSARSDYLDYLDHNVIPKLQPGERVLISPIGDSRTLMEPVRLVDASLPGMPALPSGWNSNPAQQAQHCTEEFPTAASAFKSAQSDMNHAFEQAFRKVALSKQTYLLDGFEMAGRTMKEFPGTHTLVVLSDGVEDSTDPSVIKFDQPSFWRSEKTSKMLSTLREQGRLPQLSGVEVFFVGSPRTSPELARNIRAFWLSYLESAGVNQTQIHFGARPRFRPDVSQFSLDAKSYCHTFRP